MSCPGRPQTGSRTPSTVSLSSGLLYPAVASPRSSSCSRCLRPTSVLLARAFQRNTPKSTVKGKSIAWQPMNKGALSKASEKEKSRGEIPTVSGIPSSRGVLRGRSKPRRRTECSPRTPFPNCTICTGQVRRRERREKRRGLHRHSRFLPDPGPSTQSFLTHCVPSTISACCCLCAAFALLAYQDKAFLPRARRVAVLGTAAESQVRKLCSTICGWSWARRARASIRKLGRRIAVASEGGFVDGIP